MVNKNESLLIKALPSWVKWLRRDTGYNLYGYEQEPYKDTNGKWRNKDLTAVMFITNVGQIFPFITCNDEQPTSVKKAIEESTKYGDVDAIEIPTYIAEFVEGVREGKICTNHNGEQETIGATAYKTIYYVLKEGVADAKVTQWVKNNTDTFNKILLSWNVGNWGVGGIDTFEVIDKPLYRIPLPNTDKYLYKYKWSSNYEYDFADWEDVVSHNTPTSRELQYLFTEDDIKEIDPIYLGLKELVEE